MSTCKDCIHYKLCNDADLNGGDINVTEQCEYFKDRSNFIELPCSFDLDEVTELYEDMVRCGIEYKNGNNLGREVQGTGDLLLDSASILKTVFLTKEEVEQALNKNNIKEK